MQIKKSMLMQQVGTQRYHECQCADTAHGTPWPKKATPLLASMQLYLDRTCAKSKHTVDDLSIWAPEAAALDWELLGLRCTRDALKDGHQRCHNDGDEGGSN